MIFRRVSRVVVLLLAVALVMTGCFGLARKGSSPSPGSSARLEGTLFGPEDLLDSFEVAGADVNIPADGVLQRLVAFLGGHPVSASPTLIPGEAPLSHVPVSVFLFDDFLNNPGAAQPLLTGNTDEDGKFSFAMTPPGEDLILITLTQPRMSAIVVSPGEKTAQDINTATSLVAEAVGAALLEGPMDITVEALNQMVQETTQELVDLNLDQEQLLNALQSLIPDQYGQGYGADVPASFEDIIEKITDDATSLGETYSIEGYVLNQNNDPVENVEIAFSGDYASVFTDGSGKWAKDGLRGTVTITALANATFTPDPASSTATVNSESDSPLYFYGVEDIVIDTPYTVSGTTQRSGINAPGITVKAVQEDGLCITTTSDMFGTWEFHNLVGETTLSAGADGWVFQPVTYVVNGPESDIVFAGSPGTSNLTPCPPDVELVDFVDENFEQAVREILMASGHISPGEPISKEMVEQIGILQVRDKGITHLGGIETFVSLTVLDVMGNRGLTDLAPISETAGLISVNIQATGVSDLFALSGLSNLKSLDVAGTPVWDLTPIAALTQLESLNLTESAVTDISAIASLGSLKTLYLEGTMISDMSVLSQLGNLSTVHLENTPELDWCSLTGVPEFVAQLEARGVTVHRDDAPCQGDYEVNGYIYPDPDFGGAQIPVELDFSGSKGSWGPLLVTPGHAIWSMTVQGEVTITPSTSEENWYFEPESITVNGPREPVEFSMYYVEPDPGPTVPTGQLVYYRDGALYISDVSGENERFLTSVTTQEPRPRWSPDGEYIAFLDGPLNGRTIYFIKADGSAPRHTLIGLGSTHENDDISSVDWSSTGKLVYAARSQDGPEPTRNPSLVYTANSTVPTLPTLRTSVAGTWDASPRWSPDGEHIVFTSYPNFTSITQMGPHGVYIMDAEGKNRRELVSPGVSGHSLNPAWSPDGQWIAFESQGELVYIIEADAAGGTSPIYRGGGRNPEWLGEDGEWLLSENGSPSRIERHLNEEGATRVFIVNGEQVAWTPHVE